jgi:hypothetical protein
MTAKKVAPSFDTFFDHHIVSLMELSHPRIVSVADQFVDIPSAITAVTSSYEDELLIYALSYNAAETPIHRESEICLVSLPKLNQPANTFDPTTATQVILSGTYTWIRGLTFAPRDEYFAAACGRPLDKDCGEVRIFIPSSDNHPVEVTTTTTTTTTTSNAAADNDDDDEENVPADTDTTTANIEPTTNINKPSWKLSQTLTDVHLDDVTSVVASDSYLASCSWDNSVAIWQTTSIPFTPIQRLNTPFRDARRLSWAKYNHVLVCSSIDMQHICIWSDFTSTTDGTTTAIIKSPTQYEIQTIRESRSTSMSNWITSFFRPNHLSSVPTVTTTTTTLATTTNIFKSDIYTTSMISFALSPDGNHLVSIEQFYNSSIIRTSYYLVLRQIHSSMGITQVKRIPFISNYSNQELIPIQVFFTPRSNTDILVLAHHRIYHHYCNTILRFSYPDVEEKIRWTCFAQPAVVKFRYNDARYARNDKFLHDESVIIIESANELQLSRNGTFCVYWRRKSTNSMKHNFCLCVMGDCNATNKHNCCLDQSGKFLEGTDNDNVVVVNEAT